MNPNLDSFYQAGKKDQSKFGLISWIGGSRTLDGIIPVVTEYNGVLATTSRAVAEQFGKAHKNVLRDIQRIIEQLENSESGREFSQSNFGSAFYQDSMNRKKTNVSSDP